MYGAGRHQGRGELTPLSLTGHENPRPGSCTAPDCTDSTKRPPGRKYRVLGGEASRKRRLSSFDLDALVVVKIDIAVNHLIGF